MTHLQVPDELIFTAYDEELITAWDRDFLLGLIDYPTLSDKQNQKFQTIMRKINRGKQKPQPNKQDGDFKQVMEYEAICPHCGK